MALTTNYKDDLLERLRDPKYAAGYLSACAAEGQDEFLLGLRNVTETLGGVARLAADTWGHARMNVGDSASSAYNICEVVIGDERFSMIGDSP